MCNDQCGRNVGLTTKGQLFGMKIMPRTVAEQGTTSPLIDMYVEDDEIWHYKHSFDAGWLKDLIAVAGVTQEAVDRLGSPRCVFCDSTRYKGGKPDTHIINGRTVCGQCVDLLVALRQFVPKETK